MIGTWAHVADEAGDFVRPGNMNLAIRLLRLSLGFANGAGNSFTVNGPAIGRDSLLIGAGAAVIFNDRVSVYAYYDGELARTNYSSNNVSAGLRFSF